VKSCTTMLCALVLLALLPRVSAVPMENTENFPNITSALFNEFVQDQFNADISLATVLMMLLTLTNNTTLLSLHARQQHPKVKGEKNVKSTSWIKALARGLMEKLDGEVHTLQLDGQHSSENVQVTSLAEKLDNLAKVLKLHPYTAKGKFKGKLKPISHAEIQPKYRLVNCIS